jgi:uncharacterized protein (TIGR00369 family)
VSGAKEKVSTADLVRTAKEAGDLGRFVNAIPYARFLGISVAAENDQLLATLAFSDRNIGNPQLPALHGGVVGAFLETTSILQLLWQQESILVPKTITITVDYLRTAGPVDTLAQATVTKLGSRVANVHARAWQDDPEKPVAAINANFMLTPLDD